MSDQSDDDTSRARPKGGAAWLGIATAPRFGPNMRPNDELDLPCCRGHPRADRTAHALDRTVHALERPAGLGCWLAWSTATDATPSA
jgi:hypothetical protein